jgi:hypothetical protein
MVRALASLALLVAHADAHGSGVWRDPNHYVNDESLAGLRFVAEFPAHVLTMIGTDDGSSWWMLKGSCSGPRMTQISFDFSSKGGPPDLTGTWSMADFVESITWCGMSARSSHRKRHSPQRRVRAQARRQRLDDHTAHRRQRRGRI